MNRIISYLFILILTVSIVRAEWNYALYNNKEIQSLNPDYNYLCIKFHEYTIDKTKDDILKIVFGNNLEKKIEIIITGQNSNKYKTTICKIKSNRNITTISDYRKELIKNKEVEYTGMSFVKNDKVIHLLTNEVIVKFKNNVSGFDINNLNKLYKTEILERVEGFNNMYLLKISSKGDENSDNALDISNKYSITQFVDFAQPNFIRLGMLTSPPNDSLLPQMWHIQNTGTNIPKNIPGTTGCDLNLIPAWEQARGNAKVLIAILDTGVDTNHIDLKGNLVDDRKLWYDAYDNNHGPMDKHSHGTAITGIAGAIGNNTKGTIGTGYKCRIMPIRVFGPAPSAATTDLILAKGLNWAWLHGADVLSNSWGGGLPTPIIEHAISNAYNFGRNGRGAVVLAATGNDNNDTIIFPSSMPEVIAIGGLSPCNQRKSLTSCDNFDTLENWGANYGENLSVVAPTPFIGTTLVLGGWCICASGTSSACPQAAGIAGLILTKNINLSADSVRIIIERSAKKIGNYVYGVQKQNGGWNNEMGYGRIDAKNALDITPPGPSMIYDQVPPIIDLVVPKSQSTNSAISLTANITDNELVAGGENAPKLYFYTSVFPERFAVNGAYISNNNYTFTIPKVSYGTKVYFYAAAQDTSSNQNISTYPYGGNGVNPPGLIPPSKYLLWQNTNVKDTLLASTNVPIPINQSVETTVVSILNNNFDKTILGVSCIVNIEHTYTAEVNISLISPSGTETVLAAGVGDEGDNFINTAFNDYALTSIDDTANHPPYTGSYKPLERLWFLNGESAFGEWKLKIIDNGGGDGGILNAWSLNLTYSSDYDKYNLPAKFAITGNFPNPFNPVTRIMFSVPYRARIKIKIYDLLGRELITLLDEFRNPALEDFVDFNSDNIQIRGGKGLASGVYFCTLVVDDNFIESRKLVLLK
jgi:subtilisin-like proprotein convertase family protein